jgi:hypothetical protein
MSMTGYRWLRSAVSSCCVLLTSLALGACSCDPDPEPPTPRGGSGGGGGSGGACNAGPGCTAGTCQDGFVLEASSCRPVRNCEARGCAMQGRACTPESAHTDASCGACLSGTESADGSCRIDGCEDLGCASLHRLCEVAPEPRCAEVCEVGFVWDAALAACRAPKTCEDLACVKPRVCSPGTASADAECAGGLCPNGEGWDDSAQRCRPCYRDFSPACDGEGETGNVLLLESKDGASCGCETKDGYYYSGAEGKSAARCDTDADGWVSDSAQPVIEGANPVLRKNARCHVRRALSFVLHNEAGEPRVVESFVEQFGNAGREVPAGLPLYESARNDGAESSLSQIPEFPGRDLVPQELSSLTKACAGTHDFNDNAVPDVDEWSKSPIKLDDRHGKSAELSTYYVKYARYAYFLELHSAWFDEADSSFHVAERARDVAPTPQDVPVVYPTGTDAFAAACTRHPDSQYKWREQDGVVELASKNTIGGDFAEFEVAPWAMTHHSQYKCVKVLSAADYANQNSVPADRESFPQYVTLDGGKLRRTGDAAPLGWTMNDCVAEQGAQATAVSGLQGLSPNLSCTPRQSAPTPGTVGWAAVGYENDLGTAQAAAGAALYQSRLSPGYYKRGCINECAEWPRAPSLQRIPVCSRCRIDLPFGRGEQALKSAGAAPCDDARPSSFSGKVCNGAGTCGDCIPNSKDCSGTTRRTCNGSGQWVPTGLSAECGAACTSPGATQCAGTTRQSCNSVGSWVNDGIFVGQCNAECTSNESCGSCGDATKPCVDGVWGTCFGGSVPTDYYSDADNDGWCTSSSVNRCPAARPERTRTRSECITPTWGFQTDCFDGNRFAQNSCCERITHGPNYYKKCCGGREVNGWFEFNCGEGWHLAYCDTRRVEGFGKTSPHFGIEDCPIGAQAGWISAYYALAVFEGVEGHGVAHCVPDGMDSQARSCPNPADL